MRVTGDLSLSVDLLWHRTGSFQQPSVNEVSSTIEVSPFEGKTNFARGMLSFEESHPWEPDCNNQLLSAFHW